MPNKINLTGTSGKSYNLDDLQNNNTRSDSTQALRAQIWEWNPNLPSSNPHSKPDPDNLVMGQLWYSKLVDENSIAYKKLLGGE